MSQFVHGAYETSLADTGNTAWDSDYSIFPSSSIPFILRGGYYSTGSRAGIFAMSSISGGNGDFCGFRPVICGD